MFDSLSLAPYFWMLPYIGAFVYVYYFPTFLSLLFNSKNFGPILYTNTLIGWTVGGWIGCIVWALDG